MSEGISVALFKHFSLKLKDVTNRVSNSLRPSHELLKAGYM